MKSRRRCERTDRELRSGEDPVDIKVEISEAEENRYESAETAVAHGIDHTNIRQSDPEVKSQEHVNGDRMKRQE